MAALIAPFDVPAQGGRTASTESVEDSALLPGRGIGPEVIVLATAEDIGYLEPMCSHLPRWGFPSGLEQIVSRSPARGGDVQVD